MGYVMNYPKIAKELLSLLGGKSNITALAHCATRLRLAVSDQDKIDEQAIDNLEGVKGQFKVAGQYQIIFGSGVVNPVFAELAKLAGMEGKSTTDVTAGVCGKPNNLPRR